MANKKVSSLQVSDIVSVKTMLDLAKIVRMKAAGIAKGKRAALESNRKTNNVYNPSLIGIKTPQTTKNQILIDLTLSPVAMAFEHGSQPHPIDAKNAPNLVFFWEREDVLFVGKHVNHPGFQAKPFLEPAKRATAQERRELLEKEVGKNIRTIISGMARVVK